MRFTIVAMMALGLPMVACSDIQAPVNDADVAFARGGRWATTDGVKTSDATVSDGAIDGGVDAYFGETPPTTISQASDAPPLETYQTSFNVVQGEGRAFIVHYDNVNKNGKPDWFMRLVIPPDAQFVDANGVAVSSGDTVEITVDIDPVRFLVQFGPHGSVFLGNRTADLIYNLMFADLQGQDPMTLQIWYQPTASDLWTAEPTEAATNGRQLLIDLYHFSNYAVAW